MNKKTGTWAEHIERAKAKGVLAKELYVIFTWPAGGLEAVKEQLAEHLAYQESLEQQGLMFAAGPFADEDGIEWEGEGMVIVRADSVEKAREIALADPMHRSGARKFKVKPWLLNEGSITLKVTFSDGGRELY